MRRSHPLILRLPDLITLVMVPLLWLLIDTRESQFYFMRYNLVTQVALILTLITALMAVFNPGFAILSRWCTLLAGLSALNWFEAALRVREFSIPALYMVLQFWLPRTRIRLSDDPEYDAEAAPRTVTATSNFRNVLHTEPAKPLAKEELWKRPLYTAERAGKYWTLRLANAPWPRLTLWLIGIMTAVFFVGWYLLPSSLRLLTGIWRSLYPPILPDTLHPGLLHTLSGAVIVWSTAQLAINAMLLYWVCRVLEPSLGRQRFAAYALIGAVVGVVGATLRPEALAIGAAFTGVVYTLLGAYIAITALHFRVLGLHEKQRAIGLLIIALFIFNVVSYSNLSPFASINAVSLLGGLLVGVLLVVVAGPYYRVTPDPADPNTLHLHTRSLWQVFGAR